ncbi:baculoviral IAP repeat-containing protein 7 isoform X2 [Sciurus carolinensis]|uniref:baculoviral IAP repeat-containing protein 7 isoform X2 n=1 Tax=Sciurus carolinensis TaxID=30640 RepID=UPI001FB425DA|nr:baculoviral IAP repeat-containing protein 7 isoform X2 [Sciurus carolinensis]XP_047391851.1 baculoviral IAP repeat-containing protein 7 isoform X2 [Sciurus carolinensis]
MSWMETGLKAFHQLLPWPVVLRLADQSPQPPSGQQDKVRCFFCYGGLQSWERGDDPWTEHAKWFPRCQFLLQSKGRGFVRSVQEAYSPLFGSWDQWEEPEDAAPTAPSDARGGQEWSERSQYPDVSASMSSSQLVADLLQEEYGDQAARARAPVHGAPELLTYRGEVQPEAPRSRGPAGAVAATAGGEEVQGVLGQGHVHRLRALRSPGLCGVRPQPAAVPHLQGSHPQPRAHLPVLSRHCGQPDGHPASTLPASPVLDHAAGQLRTLRCAATDPPGWRSPAWPGAALLSLWALLRINKAGISAGWCSAQPCWGPWPLPPATPLPPGLCLFLPAGRHLPRVRPT